MDDSNDYVFEKQHALQGKTVFVGSSLMEEFPVEKLFFDKGQIVYNRGISGATSKEYLEIFDRMILPLVPSQVLINIGSNDLSDAFYKLAHLLDNYKYMFDSLKRSVPHCKVSFIQFYPVNTDIMKEASYERNEQWLLQALKYRTNGHLNEASKKISQLATLYGYHSINVNNQLMGEDKQLLSAYTTDGIHLTESAYEEIFPLIYQHVNSGNI